MISNALSIYADAAGSYWVMYNTSVQASTYARFSRINAHLGEPCAVRWEPKFVTVSEFTPHESISAGYLRVHKD